MTLNSMQLNETHKQEEKKKKTDLDKVISKTTNIFIFICNLLPKYTY